MMLQLQGPGMTLSSLTNRNRSLDANLRSLFADCTVSALVQDTCLLTEWMKAVREHGAFSL